MLTEQMLDEIITDLENYNEIVRDTIRSNRYSSYTFTDNSYIKNLYEYYSIRSIGIQRFIILFDGKNTRLKAFRYFSMKGRGLENICMIIDYSNNYMLLLTIDLNATKTNAKILKLTFKELNLYNIKSISSKKFLEYYTKLF